MLGAVALVEDEDALKRLRAAAPRHDLVESAARLGAL